MHNQSLEVLFFLQVAWLFEKVDTLFKIIQDCFVDGVGEI